MFSIDEIEKGLAKAIEVMSISEALGWIEELPIDEKIKYELNEIIMMDGYAKWIKLRELTSIIIDSLRGEEND